MSSRYPGALKQFLQRVLQLRDFIRSKLREENDPVSLVCPPTVTQFGWEGFSDEY